MDAHSLARKLLSLPNHQVVIAVVDDEKNICSYCLVANLEVVELQGQSYIELEEDEIVLSKPMST